VNLLGLDPETASLSVSHTEGVSLALAVAPSAGRLGVDLERTVPERPRLARRVLTPSEAEALQKPPPWPDVLWRFCAKEAAYKALPASAQLDLTFRRLEVEPLNASGVCLIRCTSDGAVLCTVAIGSNASLVVALAEPVHPDE
jgi:4'-phosphopantetheinyl transferase EntD